MARFQCIGCGTGIESPFRPGTWHTLVVEVENVGTSRNTAKIRALNFCEDCEQVAERFAEALCARKEAVPDLVETLDERPALFNNAVPALAR